MERLQKVIAAAGITSRRKAEVLISEGRVAVNGETITELGYKVKRGDLIEVDGKAIEKEDKVFITVKSNTYARFAEIRLKNEDVVFSDNYVDITDACGISVSVDKAELKSCTSLKERVSVFSVGESYEARQ